MHEVSLNRVITDYLSGQEIMDTTYEDLRQALARMLVEDRQYPRQCLRAKYAIDYAVDGESQSTVLDLAVFSPEGAPMLALVFCPGEVGTFVRESVAAARIHRCTAAASGRSTTSHTSARVGRTSASRSVCPLRSSSCSRARL